MRVALCDTKPTLRAEYLLKAFQRGVEACGDSTLWITPDMPYERLLRNVDVAVHAYAANRNKLGHDSFRARLDPIMASQRKRVINIDTGFVRNQSDFEIEMRQGRHGAARSILFDPMQRDFLDQVMPGIHYEVGYDSIKNSADYCNAGSPGDRWEKLGVPLKPWRIATA